MRAPELIEQLARNDRSLALAVHSLLSAADDGGRATIDNVAVIYRDDYLASLRAEGKDADLEAGRLSLDEVRAHLTNSVFPRLAAEGVVAVHVGDGVHSTVAFTPGIWTELSSNRAGMAASIRTSAEHPAEGAEQAYAASDAAPAPSGSVLEARGLVKMYRR